MIIVDTREIKPLEFTNFIVKKLDTGDYSISGMEDKICIERKGSLNELYGNISQKRFWKELERMKSIPHRYLICEFPFSDIDNIPYSLGLPKKVWTKMRISPKYIHSCIKKIQYEYGVIVLFCDNRRNTQVIVEDILTRFYETRTRGI